MRLYLFEHCSLCFRVRMIAALKRLHLQETVVLDDDSDTMIGLVGKRVIPILVKNDGPQCWKAWIWLPMSIVSDEPILIGPERNQIAFGPRRWSNKTRAADAAAISATRAARIRQVAALDHYNLRKRKTLGDFVELRANHPSAHQRALMPDLEELERPDRKPARCERHTVT